MSAAAARGVEAMARGTTRHRGRWRAWAIRAVVNLLLIAIILVFAAPFAWVVASALDRADVTRWPWPSSPTLANLRALWDDPQTRQAARNSLIVAGSTMLLAVAMSAMAGYGLSRLSFRRTAWFAYALLLLQAIPVAVTMVPIFDLVLRLGLRNSYLGLILTHTAISLPLLVWLMKGFTDAVPRAMEEAAWVDGASTVRAWRDVVLPQTLPGIAVVAGFAFANAWAEVLMAVIIVTDFSKATLPFIFLTAAEGGATHATAALGVLYVAPVLLLFLALRRLMIRGLVEGLQTI